MQAHMQAQNVKPVHFDHWLGLFDDTLYANLAQSSGHSMVAFGASDRSGPFDGRRGCASPAGSGPKTAPLIGYRHVGTAKIERATPIMGWNRGTVGRDFSFWKSDRRQPQNFK